jgi:GNAT superfamily N-acetyltransferase
VSTLGLCEGLLTLGSEVGTVSISLNANANLDVPEDDHEAGSGLPDVHREGRDARHVTDAAMGGLDDFFIFINALVDEGADIFRDQKVTRAQEAEWLGRVLAEIDGRVVASAAVSKQKGCSSHVGSVGIGISQAYRDLGIGTAMLEALIAEAQASVLHVQVLAR